MNRDRTNHSTEPLLFLYDKDGEQTITTAGVYAEFPDNIMNTGEFVINTDNNKVKILKAGLYEITYDLTTKVVSQNMTHVRCLLEVNDVFERGSACYTFNAYTSQDISDCTNESGASDCCGVGWNYYKSITVDNTKVEGVLSDFPILVHLDADTDVGTHAQANGDDVKFVLANGTQLKHEIDYWNLAGDAATADFWVKIPSLPSDADTTIYMCYGNAAAGNQEDINNVWDSSFEGVYHLSESSGDALDSTVNGNDLTVNGCTRQQTGQTGLSYYFDGINDYLNVTPSPFRFTNDFTIEMIFKRYSSTRDEALLCDSTDFHGAGDISGQLINLKSADNKARFSTAISNAAVDNLDSSNIFGSGVWHYISGNRDSSSGKIIYRNGASDNNNGTTTDTFYDTSSPYPDYFEVGDFNDDEDGRSLYFKGYICEIRLSSINRSAGWIETTYNTIYDNSNFITIGAEVSVEGEGIDTTIPCGVYSAQTATFHMYKYLEKGDILRVHLRTTANTCTTVPHGCRFLVKYVSMVGWNNSRGGNGVYRGGILK